MADQDNGSLLSRAIAGGKGALANAFGGGPGGQGWDLADALSGAGAGLAMINNPAAGASMLNAITERRKMGSPQLVDMGTDLFGNKKWGLYSPQTRGFVPFGTGGQGGTPGSGGQPNTVSGGGLGAGFDTDKLNQLMQAHQNGQISDQDFAQGIPPMVREMAQGMLDGKEDPRLLGQRAAGLRSAIITVAHEMDPSFSDSQIQARQDWNKGLAQLSPTSIGGQLASAKQIIQHAYDYKVASDRLAERQMAGGSFRPLNYLQNLGKGLGPDQEFNADVAQAKQGAENTSGELVKLLSGGRGGVTERNERAAEFDLDKQPAVRNRAVTGAIGAMLGKLDEVADNHNKAFNKQPGQAGFMRAEDLLSPEDRSVMAFLQGNGPAPASHVVRNPPNAANAPYPGPRDTPATPSPSTPAPAPKSLAKASAGSIANAKAAIARGAPRDAVIKKFRDNGFDPGDL